MQGDVNEQFIPAISGLRLLPTCKREVGWSFGWGSLHGKVTKRPQAQCSETSQCSNRFNRRPFLDLHHRNLFEDTENHRRIDEPMVFDSETTVVLPRVVMQTHTCARASMKIRTARSLSAGGEGCTQ